VSEEPPPILGSWRALYALVLGALAAQVVVYWLVTRALS
jgi:hypothetical protein